MAKGYPDYTRSVNISGQDLGYVTQRPVYEAAQLDQNQIDCSAVGTHQFFDIAGKGKVLAFIVYLEYTADVSEHLLRLFIDGNMIVSTSWADFNKFNLRQGSPFIFSIPCFDQVNFKYMVTLNTQLRFDKDVKFEYYNNSSADQSNLLVSYSLVYSLLAS